MTNLQESFEAFCRESTIFYRSEQGWCAIIQPLTIPFNFHTKAFSTEEEVWEAACLRLIEMFLLKICREYPGIVIWDERENVFCYSENICCCEGQDIQKCTYNNKSNAFSSQEVKTKSKRYSVFQFKIDKRQSSSENKCKLLTQFCDYCSDKKEN